MTERATPDAAKAEAVRDLWEAELALESAGTSQTPEEARLATLMQEAPIPIISRPPERTWIWSDLHLADRSVLAAWNRPFRSTMGTVWVHELPQPKCHWDSNGLCRVLNPQGLSRSLLNFGWRTPGLLYEVIYVTPRQQPRRRAEPARPGHRPGAADRGSPGPAGSASPPPPARSPPSVESSGHHASA